MHGSFQFFQVQEKTASKKAHLAWAANCMQPLLARYTNLCDQPPHRSRTDVRRVLDRAHDLPQIRMPAAAIRRSCTISSPPGNSMSEYRPGFLRVRTWALSRRPALQRAGRRTIAFTLVEQPVVSGRIRA